MPCLNMGDRTWNIYFYYLFIYYGLVYCVVIQTIDLLTRCPVAKVFCSRLSRICVFKTEKLPDVVLAGPLAANSNI